MSSPSSNIIPVSSPLFPHRPHSPQKVPVWSPWLWSPWSPLSPWSPPHVVPVVLMLSPHGPRCFHVIPVSSLLSPIVPIAPRRSPCGLHGCGLRGLHCLCGLHPMLSPWSPCHPRVIPVVPHIIPIAPRRSPCGLHGCGLRGLCCHHPMLSPWSPCRPCHPHVVPVSSLSSPRHLEGPHIISHPPDTHSTHPLPPGALGGPKSVKMQ